MNEPQTCPSRISQGRDDPSDPNPDQWETDRWCADEEKVKAMHDEEDKKHKPGTFFRGPWNDRWLWSWGPPRTCSYCGGIHPEDAIRVMQEGWEVEGTDKFYKKYINPPGTHTQHEAFIASIKDHKREPGQGVPSVWSPAPPVKLYTDHLTQDQIDRFNEVLRERRGP